MQIRQERPDDVAAIRALTSAAFEHAPHSNQTEAKIVDALRDGGALTLSLAAIMDGQLVGHVAFSPVSIDGVACGWYGLGPVSVRPDVQRKGIGTAIIRDGLSRLRTMEAGGCVVLGEPAYYGRFGFACDPDLHYPGVPEGYFQRLSFTGAVPKGVVAYHRGFDVA